MVSVSRGLGFGGFRGHGLGFKVWGLKFGIRGLGFGGIEVGSEVAV